MRLPRRAFLAGALALGCDEKKSRPADPPQGAWREISFPPSSAYADPEHAAILVEGDGPVLVALHGRGEASKGVVQGARGWRDDYALDRASRRLRSPPLTRDDLQGFVAPARLEALNESLAAAPYRGLTVACPYTPALFDRSVAGASGFASFVITNLLGEVRKVVPAGKNGIDGVSMGGRLALLVGLSHPEVFAAVGALQPAIGVDEIGWLVALAKKAVAAGTRLRLVTSTGDYFRAAVEAFSAALTRAAVDHDLLLTEGPHDYAWNRGPGAYEMLLWHDRVLRGAAPV